MDTMQNRFGKLDIFWLKSATTEDPKLTNVQFPESILRGCIKNFRIDQSVKFNSTFLPPYAI